MTRLLVKKEKVHIYFYTVVSVYSREFLLPVGAASEHEHYLL